MQAKRDTDHQPEFANEGARPVKIIALLATLLFAQPAVAESGDLDFLPGTYTIAGPSGEVIGNATITVRHPGAMLEEERRIGEEPSQKLWFGRFERSGGWAQIFLSPNGLREFPRTSESGVWPMVFGAPVTLANGTSATFRLTITRAEDSSQSHRRLLEMSVDGGDKWRTILDYTYIAQR
jgi:hypothetical protein